MEMISARHKLSNQKVRNYLHNLFLWLADRIDMRSNRRPLLRNPAPSTRSTWLVAALSAGYRRLAITINFIVMGLIEAETQQNQLSWQLEAGTHTNLRPIRNVKPC